MADFYLAHARHDENHELVDGKMGDQVQTSSKRDTKGEVAITPFKPHKKGWFVYRPKSISKGKLVAELAKIAANNPNIGYNQKAHKTGLMEHGGVKTKEKTATDCSGLVRQCIYEAYNIDLGPFNTSNEPSFLENSGLFQPKRIYKEGMKLYDGDILVTQTKGHTAIICDSIYHRVVKKKLKK